jgi:hypothetical protein
MSWAVDNMEELRDRQHEVDDLWNEEKQHSLAELSQNAHHCEGHTCEVAICVAHENF